MRIAVLSDIHGNLTALEAVLSDLKQMAPDVVVQGGDLAASGHRPAQVIDHVRTLGWIGVRGNTDEMLWAPEDGQAILATTPKLKNLLTILLSAFAPATSHLIGEERLAWLRRLPAAQQVEGIAVIHASPTSVWVAPMPNCTDEELAATYAGLSASAVVYGHIHRPYVRKLSHMTVANCGSVGLPYDGDQRAAYLLIDRDDFVIRRVEYDVNREIQSLLHSNYPYAHWLASILRAGQYIPPPEAKHDRPS